MKDHQAEGLDWLPDYQEIVACQKSNDNPSQEGSLPPETLAKEERIYWKDYEYMIQLLPLAARECWAAADAVLDRYEYEDSTIYMEYPDKISLEKISEIVYESVRYLEDRPEMRKNDGNKTANPYYCPKDQPVPASALKEMVFSVTLWNISYRRQRYYRRRKVFLME